MNRPGPESPGQPATQRAAAGRLHPTERTRRDAYCGYICMGPEGVIWLTREWGQGGE